MNIKLKNGGDVKGSGVIDVSVGRDSYSASRAGGGRASITGYGSLPEAIITKVNMDGQPVNSNGAGTFYYKPLVGEGNVLVRSTFRTYVQTDIGQNEQGAPTILNLLHIDDCKVRYDMSSSVLTVTTLKLQSGSGARLEIADASLTVKTAPMLNSGTYLTIPSGKLTVVAGGLTVPSSMSLAVSSTIDVTGNMYVSGSISHTGGKLTVSDTLQWKISGSIPTATTATDMIVDTGCTVWMTKDVKLGTATTTGSLSVAGQLEMRGGLLTVMGPMTITGLLTHAATSDKSKSIDLDVAGKLWVKGSGKIEA